MGNTGRKILRVPSNFFQELEETLQLFRDYLLGQIRNVPGAEWGGGGRKIRQLYSRL